MQSGCASEDLACLSSLHQLQNYSVRTGILTRVGYTLDVPIVDDEQRVWKPPPNSKGKGGPSSCGGKGKGKSGPGKGQKGKAKGKQGVQSYVEAQKRLNDIERKYWFAIGDTLSTGDVHRLHSLMHGSTASEIGLDRVAVDWGDEHARTIALCICQLPVSCEIREVLLHTGGAGWSG